MKMMQQVASTRSPLMWLLAVLVVMAACGRESPNQLLSPPTITLAPDTVLMPVGETVQLHAFVANSASQAVVWSSADTSIATVNSNGFVTGRKAGTTRVTATLPTGSASATALITVVTPGTSTIASLTQSRTGSATTASLHIAGEESDRNEHKRDGAGPHLERRVVSDVPGLGNACAGRLIGTEGRGRECEA